MRVVHSYHVEARKDSWIIREIRRVGVREVARRAGVTGGMVTRWTKGQTGASDATLEGICAAIGVDVDEVRREIEVR